jgi:hypothetical protein
LDGRFYEVLVDGEQHGMGRMKGWVRMLGVPPYRFVAILLNDHYNGHTHCEASRVICEHCEAIAATKTTKGGLYRCDGRLLR